MKLCVFSEIISWKPELVLTLIYSLMKYMTEVVIVKVKLMIQNVINYLIKSAPLHDEHKNTFRIRHRNKLRQNPSFQQVIFSFHIC